MKKVLVVLLLVTMGGGAFGQVDDAIHVEFMEFTAPWLPTLSALEVRVPLAAFMDSGPLARIDTVLWYSAYSPFLFPIPFAELGAQVGFRVVNAPRSRVSVNAGTAIEFFDEGVSVPFVGSLEALFGFPFGLWTGFKTDIYVWPTGLGAEAYVPLRFLADDFPVYGGIEVGYTGLIAGTTAVHNPKIALVLGYRF
jgi:hypothetical protein